MLPKLLQTYRKPRNKYRHKDKVRLDNSFMWETFDEVLEEGMNLYPLPYVVPESHAGGAGRGTHSQNSHITAMAKILQGSNMKSFPLPAC